MSDSGSDIEALFVRDYSTLARLAFLLTQDTSIAEEIAMEAFVRAIGGWRRIRSIDRPDLYLRKIVVNLCSSNVRRRAIERRVTSRLAAETVGAHVDPTNDPAVTRALLRLPVRQRAAIVLRYYEDRSESEMAQILGCSTGTVKSQLAKARAKLERDLRPLVALEGE